MLEAFCCNPHYIKVPVNATSSYCSHTPYSHDETTHSTPQIYFKSLLLYPYLYCINTTNLYLKFCDAISIAIKKQCNLEAILWSILDEVGVV